MLWHQAWCIQTALVSHLVPISPLYQDTHTHTHTHTIPQMICGVEVRYRNKLINHRYCISGKEQGPSLRQFLQAC